ncbi:hypothetical protein [Magnetococcus sp. PR-3]|uniref:hypothetical protein n=1 Tax=Magnetococcus sp. PR-3 TaxID=3120355 RepID=UPI002FCDF23B
MADLRFVQRVSDPSTSLKAYSSEPGAALDPTGAARTQQALPWTRRALPGPD